MRRLATPDAEPLAAEVEAQLDRYLLTGAARPLAVALSGGGDSLALLLMVRNWADRAGRPVIALTVDHRLQPLSGAWTERCAATAERLGVGFRALAWDGTKPERGVPAAARTARHRLLADAAREAGAQVLLMGHTADDLIEARLMREAGSTTPDPRPWAPSPAWPQGRGVFLLRPMLGVRRAELRAWLAARGESWIDDPANDDLRSSRARARISAAALDREPAAVTPDLVTLANACPHDPAGDLAIPRQMLRDADPDAARRFIAIACVCAGGGGRKPAASAMTRLAEALRRDGDLTATLAGARVEADARSVLVCREVGEAKRGGLQPLRLRASEAMVWDGRFEVRADRDGLEVRRLGGLIKDIPSSLARDLYQTPAALRNGLPVIVYDNGHVACPVFTPLPQVSVRSLVLDRLRAACGVVAREQP